MSYEQGTFVFFIDKHILHAKYDDFLQSTESLMSFKWNFNGVLLIDGDESSEMDWKNKLMLRFLY